MLRFIHNDKVSLGWAILVEIVVHLLFAAQAFLLGGFLGEVALKSIFGPYGADIGSWGLAIFIFGAAFQAFVLGEYMREHVESFESTAKGDGSYIRNWKLLRWLVGGLEVSSLLFRCIAVLLQGDLLQAGIVALFGAIALWYAFAQAKVIHASVNRPVEYEVMRARDMAGRSVVDDAMKYVPQMTAGDKKRFLTGDLSVIDEYQQSMADKEREKLQPKAEKQKKARQRQEHGQQEQYIASNYTGKILGNQPLPPGCVSCGKPAAEQYRGMWFCHECLESKRYDQVAREIVRGEHVGREEGRRMDGALDRARQEVSDPFPEVQTNNNHRAQRLNQS